MGSPGCYLRWVIGAAGWDRKSIEMGRNKTRMGKRGTRLLDAFQSIANGRARIPICQAPLSIEGKGEIIG